MTSAARPTFLPAVGGHSLRDTGAAPTHITRAKEQTAHTKLKQRADRIDDNTGAIDFKRKLEDREQEHSAKKNRNVLLGPGRGEDPEVASARRALIQAENIDADDSDDPGSSGTSSDDNSDDNSDDDDDDTAELMRELAKIKRERAEELERQESEKLAQETRELEERAMTGNPLLQATNVGTSSGSSNFTVKRRWDDDVIFKNQGKGTGENGRKQFINDMLRSDFHRKFMNKYVR
ncbi:hypothetical protein BASA50_004923 [Batrachochytrium salamandrivorans]|uniref:Cwf15/Cwc15 cell cycle control protein n=1 Tax=Batrachochytrium salamandrivorans TaxID=1357716 RepID=A0ABQ8FFG4_9FUNG|nr:hypothetical protein BASA62_003115 [Batrachochytrium salamandrivorans]KAH6585395.1 hypothetical protein BASA61_006857 [Batrachochytrium salamandrivorans]KAH6596777.1 hypothetical protein BASA50_004923 [Batrachochytrium salamandrivorans]